LIPGFVSHEMISDLQCTVKCLPQIKPRQNTESHNSISVESTPSHDVDEFLVELEVFGCGDLIVRKVDDSEVSALEFKVAAKLQDNQNPFKLEFFARGGYGANIKKAYPMERTYIVVRNEREVFGDFSHKGMRCIGKSWRDVYDCSHGAPLINDLFESFVALEIPVFIHMKTKHTERLTLIR